MSTTTNSTSNQFIIQVTNNSNKPIEITLAQSPPIPANSTQPPLLNTLMKSPSMPKEAHAKFDIDVQYYAICGTVTNPLSPNSGVNIADSRKVKIAYPDAPGTKLRLTTINHEGIRPVFDNTYEGTTTRTGNFVIDCEESLSRDRIGTSNPHNADNVVVESSFLAAPGKETFLSPKIEYYIGVVDDSETPVSDLSKMHKVDFGHGSMKQAFSYNAQGGFDDLDWSDL